MYIVPAKKDNDRISRGRASGGLATIWKKSITKYVSQVKCGNYRLQATKFSFPNCPLLIINSYFPCDPQVENFDDSELVTLLADIRSTMLQANCNNVLLAADMNCHFRKENRFTNTVQAVLEEMGLVVMGRTRTPVRTST